MCLNKDYHIRIIMPKADWEKAILNTNMCGSPLNGKDGETLPGDTTGSLHTAQICLG